MIKFHSLKGRCYLLLNYLHETNKNFKIYLKISTKHQVLTKNLKKLREIKIRSLGISHDSLLNYVKYI